MDKTLMDLVAFGLAMVVALAAGVVADWMQPEDSS